MITLGAVGVLHCSEQSAGTGAGRQIRRARTAGPFRHGKGRPGGGPVPQRGPCPVPAEGPRRCKKAPLPSPSPSPTPRPPVL